MFCMSLIDCQIVSNTIALGLDVNNNMTTKSNISIMHMISDSDHFHEIYNSNAFWVCRETYTG